MGGFVGLGLGLLGTIYSGVQQRRAADEQAAIALAQSRRQGELLEQNSQLARDQAETVARQGWDEEEKLRRRARQMKGEQAAAYGASGVSLSSGSPLDLAYDTNQGLEEDLAQSRENWGRRKFGYVAQAGEYYAKAQMARAAGENQAAALKAQGRSAMLGSLLTGASLVAGKWDGLFGRASVKKKPSPARAFWATPPGWSAEY